MMTPTEYAELLGDKLRQVIKRSAEEIARTETRYMKNQISSRRKLTREAFGYRINHRPNQIRIRFGPQFRTRHNAENTVTQRIVTQLRNRNKDRIRQRFAVGINNKLGSL